MNKFGLTVACVMGITGIAIGAFAAHGLKTLISIESLQTFETGVRYQLYHALFLLCINMGAFLSSKQQRLVTVLTLIGVCLFSGSIYGLSTNSLTVFDFKIIAFITPIGGLMLILAWATLLFYTLKAKRN